MPNTAPKPGALAPLPEARPSAASGSEVGTRSQPALNQLGAPVPPLARPLRGRHRVRLVMTQSRWWLGPALQQVGDKLGAMLGGDETICRHASGGTDPSQQGAQSGSHSREPRLMSAMTLSTYAQVTGTRRVTNMRRPDEFVHFATARRSTQARSGDGRRRCCMSAAMVST